MPDKSLVIDGLIAVETPDTSGEILIVKGCNIDTLELDGVLNVEHKMASEAGHSFNDTVGKCIKAKKIFSAEDCSSDRERMYWDMFKLPMIYGQFRLYNDQDHPGAKAAAAIMLSHDKRGEAQLLRFSIEGSTIKRNGNRLEETVSRAVALTQRPANHAAVTGVVEGTSKPKTLLEEITEDTKKFETVSGLERLGGASTSPSLMKTYTATMGDGGLTAPHGALQVEHLDRAVKKELDRRKLLTVVKTILRDSDTLDGAKAAIKHELGDMSPEFVNLFDRLADEWRVRKSQEMFLSKAEPLLKMMMKGAAFKHIKTGQVVFTGPVHDADNLPSPYVHPKTQKAQWIDGFVDNHGNFYNREEAMRAVKTRSAPYLGSSLESGQYNEGVEEGYFKSEDGDKPPKEKKTTPKQYKQTLGRLQEKGAVMPPKETMGKPHVRKVKKGHTYFDEEKGVLYAPGKAFKMYVPQGDEQYKELLNHPELQKVHDTALKNWVTLHRLYRSGNLPDEVVALAGLFSAQSPNTTVPTQELAFAHWMDLNKLGFDPAEPDERYGAEFERRAQSRQMPETDADQFGPGSPVRTKAGNLPIIGLRSQKVAGAMSYGQMHGIIKEMLSQGKSGRDISATLNELKHRNFLAGQRGEEAGGEGKGFAPKTIRYLLGMAGIGDILVPDTHFIRHSFGLHVDDPANQEIKDILWQASNESAVAGMDRYYYRNHPAVGYTKDRLKRLGVDEDLGEHVIFPSFWAHWLSVVPHERLRGWNAGQASNEGTDHRVYFNAVQRALSKRGIPFNVHQLHKAEPAKESMPARIADAVAEIESQWGPELAQFAFYSHMVPALLANTHHLRKAADAVAKLEALAKNLFPTAAKPSTVVDVDSHGLPGLAHHPDQRDLIHGLDLEGKVQAPSPGMADAATPNGEGESLVNEQTRMSGGYKPRLLLAPSGRTVFVKPNVRYGHLDGGDQFSMAQREAAFHSLARDYFGMGAHVPTTAAFHYPGKPDQHMSGQEFVPAAGHRHDTNVLAHLGHSGVLDKAAIMDTILANPDRHNYNFLTSAVPPYLHLIDNGMAFSSRQRRPFPPEYLAHYGAVLDRLPKEEQGRMAQLHPDAQSWLMAMDPQKLSERMHALGVPGPHVQESVRRLKEMQARVLRGPVTKNGIIVSPFWR